MKIYRVIFCVIFVFLLNACQSKPNFECTDTLACVTIPPDAPIKIGVIHDLSAGAAAFGIEQVRSLELALADHGDALLGHPIELLTEDEQCTAEGGANAALRIIADPQVIGIFGTTCSSAAAAAGEKMAPAGLVMVSGVNSSPSLTSNGGDKGEDWHPGYYRTMMNVMAEAKVSAIFAYEELGVRQAATVDDADTFSTAYAEAFRQHFISLGGKVVQSAVIDKEDINMQPVLQSLSNAKPQLIFMALYPDEGAHILQQIDTVPELADIVWFGGGSLRTDEFVEMVGEHGIGTYFIGSAPPPAGPAHDALLAAYQTRYGENPETVTYGYGYDAADLLLSAIEAIAVQEEDGTLYIGRQALRDHLYATRDFAGIMGKFSCDQFGDCAVVKLDLVQFEDPAAGVEGLLFNTIATYPEE